MLVSRQWSDLLAFSPFLPFARNIDHVVFSVETSVTGMLVI